MTNLRITFLYPWLLLLLVPAVALVLFFYLRLSRKYRRTRNRIISIVLYLLIMVLSVSVLSGMAFAYEKLNTTNEIILLVDVSYSNRETQDEKNEFVKRTLERSQSSFKTGVVIFAKEQKYVAPLSYNTENIYLQYLSSIENLDIDDTSTDIASALYYVASAGIFSDPKNGKIVLISDGIQTDGNATSAVVAISSSGIRVDTVSFPNEYGDELQIIGIETPEYNIIVGEPVTISVTVQSSFVGTPFMKLFDNGVADPIKAVSVSIGVETFDFTHTFGETGAHEICFTITDSHDAMVQNNSYYAYIFLDVYNRILIIDKGNESQWLEESLKENYSTEEKDRVTVKKIDDTDLPDTVEDLRQYDQVILMNIANADMPHGFPSILYDYVNVYGGALLTVGGNGDGEVDGKPVPNAYNRSDMVGTLYQKMLPVDCVDYTPPIALMLVIDRSGSMSTRDIQTNKTRLDLAKEGAAACLDALSERDYIGIISFENYYTLELPLTSIIHKSTILDRINKLKTNGGTSYTGAIDRAGLILQGITNVERRHIMFVTDGEPGDLREQYEPLIARYYNDSGITLSAISIVGSDISEGSQTIYRMARLGHGGAADVPNKDLDRFAYPITDGKNLPDKMRSDLEIPEIKEMVYEPFTPTVRDYGIPVRGLVSELDDKGNPILDNSGKPIPVVMPSLDGFYGVRLKAKTEENRLECSLVGAEKAGSPPIYAQWKLGKGKVGSFMCDLNGIWSAAFLNDPKGKGKLFINNVLSALSPSENIRAEDFDAEFMPDNYKMQIRIKTTIDQGDRIRVTVTSPSKKIDIATSAQVAVESQEKIYWAQISPSETARVLAKCAYDVYEPGIYKVVIEKINAVGEVVGKPLTTYRTFSYSSEYNAFIEPEFGVMLLSDIAEKGKGTVITEPQDIYISYEIIDKKAYDPRIIFITIAVALFLLDIAVRKFKFKWPWEIIRDYKIKKHLNHGVGKEG